MMIQIGELIVFFVKVFVIYLAVYPLINRVCVCVEKCKCSETVEKMQKNG